MFYTFSASIMLFISRTMRWSYLDIVLTVIVQLHKVAMLMKNVKQEENFTIEIKYSVLSKFTPIPANKECYHTQSETSIKERNNSYNIVNGHL